MQLPLRLTWGNDHSLVLTTQGAVITGLLYLKKKNGEQKIPIMFPPEITVMDVSDGWKAQNAQWKDLYTMNDDNAFVSLRVIHIPGKGCILWFIHHVDDKPKDTCVYSPFGKKITTPE